MGRNIICRKKSTWVGPNSHVLVCGQWTKVHRTYFAERGRNRSGSRVFPIWDILFLSGDIRDQFGSCVKSTQNLARVKNFRGGPLIFGLALRSRRIYAHILPFHCTKFRVDRPTKLGDPVRIKKNITSKTEGLPELPLRAA